ncbi:hypothetical protein NC652_032655 [Populus alba x Populus x berolinensis]|uniref:Uncharacterized protein n=1 Tax=Populus alba x Populus x berolinensis TaxID=444605 RepID=A0AAD6LRU5_9ROSI|nr:hypothetical protein NC652_032655 [Populus alba x Populus x berolinensis]KAJ6972081.1 hypothetical protein NC653_032605 [Populus alba x Populus x berolinensis]KAJ6972086.1 hypothetical protein NC653_032610 [Populus alba x Populus x berolinensis]
MAVRTTTLFPFHSLTRHSLSPTDVRT